MNANSASPPSPPSPTESTVPESSSTAARFTAHHDLGGNTDYCDPVPLADGAPPDDFGRRVDALRQVLFAKRIFNGTDEFRRGIELIPKPEYDSYQYYEKWLHALRILLLEKAVITAEELR